MARRTGKTDMNASDYKIAVQRVQIDGETLFMATVKEFPDLVLYEESAAAVYADALEAIEDLVEMAGEMGHPIPQPSMHEDDDYSGKMTFRPGKRLHRDIAAAAEADGLSQNQWLCNVVARAVSVHTARTQLREAAADAFDHMKTATFSTWRTVLEPTQTPGQAAVGVLSHRHRGSGLSHSTFGEPDLHILELGKPGFGYAIAEPVITATGAATVPKKTESDVASTHLMQAEYGT